MTDRQLEELISQLRRIGDQLEFMNLNGVTVFGGEEMNEN